MRQQASKAGRCPGPRQRQGLCNPFPLQTDWLHHALRVSGPAAAIERFRAAACGAAAIPWHLDLDREEQRLLAPMAMHGADARALARALRHAVATHHDRVLAQVARGGVCPLDLHRLLPVPEPILRLGPDDPASQRWLWQHWGTGQPLRHVRLDHTHTDRRLRRSAVLQFGFHAADWSPWQALLRLRAVWPSLVFDLRPHYPDG